MHAMTAAHTTLPLPTWVEVTNLVNGKRVVVKVNDRGPFVDNRLIDLSYAAATALDMVGTGTTRVEVRAVAPPLDACRGGSAVAAAPQALPPAAPQRVRRGAHRAHVRADRRVLAARERRAARRALARERLRESRPSSASPTTGAGCTACWLGPIRDSVEFDADRTRACARSACRARGSSWTAAQ